MSSASKIGFRTPTAPPIPDTRPPTRGVCMLCGHRLVPNGHGGWVHESGMVRCDPPATSICGICRGDALYQCGTTGCGTMAHPDCLTPCSCCGRLLCPTHALDVDGAVMCEGCANVPPIQERHV